MIIDYPDMLLVLRNFAQAYNLTPTLEREVDNYIFSCLRHAVEQQGGVTIPPGGTIACVMEKNNIFQNLPKVEILQEGMKMMFDIFGNENDQLIVQYTEVEYKEKMR